MNEIIYGLHTVKALLNEAPERFQEVFILKERKDKVFLILIHMLKTYGILIKTVNRRFLDKKTKKATHQGIVAYIKSAQKYQESILPDLVSKFNNPFLLILDRITDPHNLGACLRTADAAGINLVIVPKVCSAKINSIVKKVACGAAEKVPLIRVTNLARTLRMLQEKNFWIIGTTSKANHTLYQSKMTGRIALVMGSENKGLRYITRKCCNELINIPMIGSVSSLNVSVATGICLFEALRQRSSMDQ